MEAFFPSLNYSAILCQASSLSGNLECPLVGPQGQQSKEFWGFETKVLAPPPSSIILSSLLPQVWAEDWQHPTTWEFVRSKNSQHSLHPPPYWTGIDILTRVSGYFYAHWGISNSGLDWCFFHFHGHQNHLEDPAAAAGLSPGTRVWEPLLQCLEPGGCTEILWIPFHPKDDGEFLHLPTQPRWRIKDWDQGLFSWAVLILPPAQTEPWTRGSRAFVTRPE